MKLNKKLNKIRHQAKRAEQIAKYEGAKIKAQTKLQQAKNKFTDTQQKNKGYKNAWERWKERKMKAQEVNLRKQEASAQMAEQQPKLQQQKFESKLRVAETGAINAGKIGVATALARGAAALGKGLSDEGNQDEALSQAWQAKRLDTIFNSKSDKTEDGEGYGLEQGVE